MSKLTFVEQSTSPSTPATDKVTYYTKSDRMFYSKNDAGLEVRVNEVKGADVASASTINLDSATGNLVDVTGTTTITAITLSEGKECVTRFTGILTLTHGASLVLLNNSQNMTTAAGDFAVWRGYASGVVRMVSYGYIGGPTVADNAITQAKMANSAIGQAELKTTTASATTGNITTGSTTTITLTGGTYSWWTGSSTTNAAFGFTFGADNTSAGVIGLGNASGASLTFSHDERYVQASPPYTHGPIFVFLILDGLGAIESVSVAFDPTWAYHGPTDIRPQVRRDGKSFRKVATYDGMTLREALASKNDALKKEILEGRVERQETEQEITLAYKDSDINVAPHPWYLNKPEFFTGKTVAMLEPGTPLALRLAEIGEESHAAEVKQLILDGYLSLDNTPIVLPTQPARVSVLRADWKR